MIFEWILTGYASLQTNLTACKLCCHVRNLKFEYILAGNIWNLINGTRPRTPLILFNFISRLTFDAGRMNTSKLFPSCRVNLFLITKNVTCIIIAITAYSRLKLKLNFEQKNHFEETLFKLPSAKWTHVRRSRVRFPVKFRTSAVRRGDEGISNEAPFYRSCAGVAAAVS